MGTLFSCGESCSSQVLLSNSSSGFLDTMPSSGGGTLVLMLLYDLWIGVDHGMCWFSLLLFSFNDACYCVF